MSDAAVAIILCVLILDITVEHFPTDKAVNEEGFSNTLEHMGGYIEIYLLTFFYTWILWNINHAVISEIHTIDIVVLYLQKVFLAFISLSPLCSHILNEFAYSGSPDGNLAIIVGLVFPLSASVANVLMLFWGYYKKEHVMYPWAVFSKAIKANKAGLWYVLLKTILPPLWMLIGIFVCLGPWDISGYVKWIVLGLIGLTLILLKMVFMCHVGKHYYISKRHQKSFKEGSFELHVDQKNHSHNSNGHRIEAKEVESKADFIFDHADDNKVFHNDKAVNDPVATI